MPWAFPRGRHPRRLCAGMLGGPLWGLRPGSSNTCSLPVLATGTCHADKPDLSPCWSSGEGDDRGEPKPAAALEPSAACEVPHHLSLGIS